MGEAAGPSATYTGAPQAGWDSNALMQTWQGYTPEQQAPYMQNYMGADPGQQQQWLDFFGTSSLDTGNNTPGYLPPAPPDPTKTGNYPTSPVSTGPMTGPVTPPGGPPAPAPPTTAEGGAPWDDLSSERFRNWFNAELSAGRSPGLNYTGADPGSAYGTYNSGGEQQAMMAQFQALPPEAQAAYVQRYMSLTPPEQAQWRNAFGADPMVGTVGGADLRPSGTPIDGLNDWTSPYENQPQMGWQWRPNGQPYQWGIINDVAPPPGVPRQAATGPRGRLGF